MPRRRTHLRRREFNKLGLGIVAGQACKAMRPLRSTSHTAVGMFPENFAWGASTSALQTEGSPYINNGGRSIWSVLDDKPALIKDGSNDLVANDSYHLFREDIELLKDMGLNSYRLSISWPRVLPAGQGKPNPKGLSHYDRLIDSLLAAGITPWVTVYHFDYPQALEEEGGWLHPDSSRWLGDYAAVLSKHFGDRIAHWMTINEPNITWSFGWEAGVAPPYHRLSLEQLALGAHNMLLGHGRAVAALRAGARNETRISLPIAGQIAMPATDTQSDREAARQRSFTMAPHLWDRKFRRSP